jgi:hypothetical protein
METVKEITNLFKRYIQHVVDCEGVNFLDKIHFNGNSIKFTDDEIEFLNKLAEDERTN